MQDDEKEKKGGEAKRIVVYETGDGPEAYAVYKVKADWNVRGSASVLTVDEAVATTPRGTREIWRFLFDVDLMATLKAWHLPVDHPLFTLMAEPRRLGRPWATGSGCASSTFRRPSRVEPTASPAAGRSK